MEKLCSCWCLQTNLTLTSSSSKVKPTGSSVALHALKPKVGHFILLKRVQYMACLAVCSRTHLLRWGVRQQRSQHGMDHMSSGLQLNPRQVLTSEWMHGVLCIFVVPIHLTGCANIKQRNTDRGITTEWNHKKTSFNPCGNPLCFPIHLFRYHYIWISLLLLFTRMNAPTKW